MILKLYTAAALITAASIVSCAGNKDKEYIDKSIIPSGTETTTAQPVAPVTTTQDPTAVQANTVPGTATVNPGTAMPVNVNQQPQPINLNPQNKVVLPNPAQQNITQTQAQTTTAPGMNPPHGQPGHRCDISVGAPLNSKPAPANTPPPATVTTQQPPVTVTQQPTQQKTLPGMNPPHGEPGHRCDISVGAPLNSKPATPAAAPAQTATPPPLLTPVKKDSRP